MLKDYFNTEIITQMTFKEFEATYRGNDILIKYRISLKDAFKQLGGKMTKKKVKKEEGN